MPRHEANAVVREAVQWVSERRRSRQHSTSPNDWSHLPCPSPSSSIAEYVEQNWSPEAQRMERVAPSPREGSVASQVPRAAAIQLRSTTLFPKGSSSEAKSPKRLAEENARLRQELATLNEAISRSGCEEEVQDAVAALPESPSKSGGQAGPKNSKLQLLLLGVNSNREEDAAEEKVSRRIEHLEQELWGSLERASRLAAGQERHVQDLESSLMTEEQLQATALLGLLTVTVVQADELVNKDTFTQSDPYCIVTCGAEHFRTATVDDKNSPHWGESFNFWPSRPDQDTLQVDIFDCDAGDGTGHDNSLGSVTVQVKDVIAAGVLEKAFLVGKKTGFGPSL